MASASEPAALEHVRWIGGGSGAGKTTIAARLADAIGGKVYSTDDAMSDHAPRLSSAEAPLLATFRAMSMDERWVARPPRTMLDTFPWFAGEGFEQIVADLTAGDHGTPTIAEGFRLLPRLVAPLLVSRRHAVWLLPTPAFRAAVFAARRGTAADIPGRTRDPDLALAHLLERDGLFTDRIKAEVHELGLQAITVEVGMTVDEVAAEVAGALVVSASTRRARPPARSWVGSDGSSGRFVRIESATADDAGRRIGLFGLLRDLRHSGGLDPADAERAASMVVRSYDLHVEPPAAAYAGGAISWFLADTRSDASCGLRDLCAEIVDLLDRYGVATRTARTDDPGRITYIDDVQVVALPPSSR